jgi:predicted nuclease with TOPRIM domain
MEDARDKLHQQINANQDLREENQKLKSSTNLLKDEFHCYTKELEGLHEEELEAWKSKVNDQHQQIEIEISNNTDLKTQLDEAHTRYVDFERMENDVGRGYQ